MKKKKLEREEFCALLEKIPSCSDGQIDEILEDIFDETKRRGTNNASTALNNLIFHLYMEDFPIFDAVAEYINISEIQKRATFVQMLGLPKWKSDKEILQYVEELLKRMI